MSWVFIIFLFLCFFSSLSVFWLVMCMFPIKQSQIGWVFFFFFLLFIFLFYGFFQKNYFFSKWANKITSWWILTYRSNVSFVLITNSMIFYNFFAIAFWVFGLFLNDSFLKWANQIASKCILTWRSMVPKYQQKYIVTLMKDVLSFQSEF